MSCSGVTVLWFRVIISTTDQGDSDTDHSPNVFNTFWVNLLPSGNSSCLHWVGGRGVAKGGEGGLKSPPGPPTRGGPQMDLTIFF